MGHMSQDKVIGDFEKQLASYRLTTAEILYHMPDYPLVLQTFVWQELDMAPRYPVLKKFLHYWHEHLDGKLHSVKVASIGIIKPAEFRLCDAFFRVQ